MKLAIILILGMVSCFEIGQAADGASGIENLMSLVQNRIEGLTKHCKPAVTKGMSVLKIMHINEKTINSKIVNRVLSDIQTNINSRPLLLRDRYQHCYTNANKGLQKLKQTTERKLQKCFEAVLFTLNNNNGNAIVKEGEKIINKLNNNLQIPTPEYAKIGESDFNKFEAAASAVYKTCTELPEISQSEATDCFQTESLERNAWNIWKAAESCIKGQNNHEE